MTKILLVEDDVSLRDIYFARFESEGYTVATASNGEEALAAAVKEKPDLMLLDIMMPRISGFDVLDIIRTTPETANTRVIMMTALSDPESKEKGQRLGVNQFLVKSQVTLDDIVIAVKKELATPTAEKQAPVKLPDNEPILGAPKHDETTMDTSDSESSQIHEPEVETINDQLENAPQPEVGQESTEPPAPYTPPSPQ